MTNDDDARISRSSIAIVKPHTRMKMNDEKERSPMRRLSQLSKGFALSSLSILMVACGGGGGDDGNGNTQPPVANQDLFTIKAKEWKITPAADKSYCYDIDQQAETSCDDDSAWDVKFAMGSRTPLLFTNSGVSGKGQGGALYSPFDGQWDKLSKELNATQGGAVPETAWVKDSYGNAFMETKSGFNAFFEYDLFGDHLMSPNFKTFLLTTDTTVLSSVGTAEKPVYAMQIVNYYRGASSGFVTLRYIDTRQPNDVRELTVDASKGWVYVDLSTASSSTENKGNWQIAFDRYNVQLNSGIGSMVASQPAGFYNAEGKPILDKFKDAQAYHDTVNDLKAAASTSVKKWGGNSVTSILNPSFRGVYPSKLDYGWYNYYPTVTAAQADGLAAAHMLKANPNAATMLRGNRANSYARMHLKQIQYADPLDNASATTWTFELDIQPGK